MDIKNFKNFSNESLGSLRVKILQGAITSINSGQYSTKKSKNCLAVFNRGVGNSLQIFKSNWAYNFDDITLTPQNVNNYRYETGLRGLLLLEWVKLGNSILVKYESYQNPYSPKSFDQPLKEFFTPKELALMDTTFFGKGVYLTNEPDFDFSVDVGLNFVFDWAKTLAPKLGYFENIRSFYQAVAQEGYDCGCGDHSELQFYKYEAYDTIVLNVDSRSDISESKFSEGIAIHLFEHLINSNFV